MRFLKKIVLTTGTIAILCSQPIFAQSSLIEKNSFSKMNATQIEKLVDQLVAKHPQILTKVKIGTSADGNTMYAIQLHKSDQLVSEALYHGLVESGTHARETVNPYITIKMIETYANDLENDKTLPDINMSQLLDKSVLHFIPMSNPDGYNVVKFGPSAIRTSSLKQALMKFGKGKYSEFKASATGVDLNRNYPVDYYSVASNKWTIVPFKYGGPSYSTKPSKEFYAGPKLASEPETRAVMSYIQMYDFRFLASYHSRGNIIYYERPYLGLKEYDQKVEKYARIAATTASYRMVSYKQSVNYNGYLGDYFANQTLRPAVTIETTVSTLPTKAAFYDSAFSRVKTIPAKFMMETKKESFSPYWVYIGKEVKKNFINKDYALAFASLNKGQFVLGQPSKEINSLLADLNINRESTFNRLSAKLVESLNPPVVEEQIEQAQTVEVASSETSTQNESSGSAVNGSDSPNNTSTTEVIPPENTSNPKEPKTISYIQKLVSLNELINTTEEEQWIYSNCIVKLDWTPIEVDPKLGQMYQSTIQFCNVDLNEKSQNGKVEIKAYVQWVNKQPKISKVEYLLTLQKQQ